MKERNKEPDVLDRALVAAACAGFGFVTGIIAVWALASLPGFSPSKSVYLGVALVLTLFFSVVGFVSPDKASDMLGALWTAIGKVWDAILQVTFFR